MGTYSAFIKNNIAPYSAHKIGVYDSTGNRVGSIPLGAFKPNYGERLYRFGLISDVHNETSQATDNSEDLINALTWFNDNESIEFTVISGDLTQTSYSSNNLATEMSIFQSNKNSVSPNTPVYPVTGNHDCPQSSDVNISTFYSYTDASGIAPSSGANFSYEKTFTHTTSGGTVVTDHFLFLSMKRYEFSTNTYDSTDLTWLANKLEAYKNDRCFVITHMFFPSYAGNFKRIYPSGNWLSGTMLTQLKNLIDSYPRTIWFSGHSHWKWYLQQYEDKANVYPISNNNRTTGWAVHVPSCASPIDSDGVSTRVSMSGQSEGAVVDVYQDYIDIRAVEFKGAGDSTYANRYLPIGQYRLYTQPESSNTGSTTGETTIKTVLVAKCNRASTGLAVESGHTSGSPIYVQYSDIKFIDENGNDVTSTVTSVASSTSNSYKVGIYTTGHTYSYAPAGTSIPAEVKVSASGAVQGVIPIVQVSSSSPISANTNTVYYVQLKDIKVSENQTDWRYITSESTIYNGTQWGKGDISYVWTDAITNDPASLFTASDEAVDGPSVMSDESSSTDEAEALR